MGEKVMMTLVGSEDPPTIEQAAKKLGTPVSALDSDFGVVLVDNKRWIYTVRVDAAALPAEQNQNEGVSGPFSDPKIAPFGLPE